MWQPYPRNRKIAKKEGYVVIVPENYEENTRQMPLFCGVCRFRFSSREDEKSYEMFKCCSLCADTWAYSHRQEWEKGWRPSLEQIEKVIEKRIFVNENIRFE